MRFHFFSQFDSFDMFASVLPQQIIKHKDKKDIFILFLKESRCTDSFKVLAVYVLVIRQVAIIWCQPNNHLD